jgi:methylmalonyl-CoA/ethylmalonyl-CoA epimerase
LLTAPWPSTGTDIILRRSFRCKKPAFGGAVELPLDHVAIAVADLTGARSIYEALTGARSSTVERIASQGVDVVFVGQGEARVELIAPAGEDSPLARFLERRGPGLHHVAFRVTDLAAKLAELAARGVELIDHAPRLGSHGRRIAFLHPRATGGVLVELIEA